MNDSLAENPVDSQLLEAPPAAPADGRAEIDEKWRSAHADILRSQRKARDYAGYAGLLRGGIFIVAAVVVAQYLLAVIGPPSIIVKYLMIIRAVYGYVFIFIGFVWVSLEVYSGQLAINADWMFHVHDYLATPSFNIPTDVRANLSTPNSALPSASVGVRRRNSAGAPMAEWWPDFVAELVSYTVEVGLPDGVGHQGQSEVIREVCARMVERDKPEPSRTQIQETVNAVLRRNRLAGNGREAFSG